MTTPPPPADEADGGPEDGDALRASCACGAVRLNCHLPHRFVTHCHCANCRRAHGAGVVTWIGFDAARFRVVAGEDDLRSFRTPTEATRRFCGCCGTTMTYEGPRWAGQVHVAVGVLDDPPPALPSGHFYADRAPDWCPITDDLPRYGGEDGGQRLDAPPPSQGPS